METKTKRAAPTGIRHLLFATTNSLRGIRDAFRTASAFRQECALLAAHYVAIALVPMRFELGLALALAGPLLLAAELVNSAVEAVVDLVSPDWNLLARYAKDFCSAAVFMILVAIFALWATVAYLALS